MTRKINNKKKVLDEDDTKHKDFVKLVEEELRHYNKTKIPRCAVCKTNMQQIDKYSWKTVCGHSPDLILNIG